MTCASSLISCPTLTVSAPGRSVRAVFVGVLLLFSAAGFFLLFFITAGFGFAAALPLPAACVAIGASNTAHARNKQANRITSTSGRLGNSEHVAQARIALFRNVHIM